MKILAPSILTADFSNLAQQIRYIEMGGADWIHCDVMDGQFVPNLTFGPMIVEKINQLSKLTLDVHLMMYNADKYIERFIKAGADYLTLHQEAISNLDEQLKIIKELGAKAGVTINPDTPLSVLYDVLPNVDMVLIMSVYPGFGGQKFMPNSLDKIKELDKLRKENGYNYLIEIDGGININNVKTVMEAGCDVFVIGSSIYNTDNISAATMEFKNILRQ